MRRYQFSIPYTQYLDHHGRAVQSLPPWALDLQRLISFYRAMVLARTFDQKAIALQRTGQLGTYASCLGQESVGVAVGYAMDRKDMLAPAYRDHAAQLLRGVSIPELLLFWGGDERGSDFRIPRDDLPNCVPVATQTTHAAGVATAFRIRGEPRVAVCLLGDGSTSRGDFLESLNLAGVWKLPVVYVINNNQWAISVPRHLQSRAETLAQKAIGAGIPGEQVDGCDVIAVHEAMQQALTRARSGKGPTLIEALTYRLGDHTTADDATRYRPADELSRAWTHDPVKRLQTFLHEQRAWDEGQEQALQEECTAQMQEAVEEYLAVAPQPPEAMFTHLFRDVPSSLAPQVAHALAKAKRLNPQTEEEPCQT